MRTFKNWKSELKKKGAMALTAFMLCGSAGTAFAQSTTPITILDEGTGDTGAGNVKTVTGYQTDKAVGYAANITWGNMLFVYDRGTYDPSSGILIGSFQDDSPTPREDIEMNGDRIQAGFWYGFDGENNAVKIENLSTEAVNLTATPEVTGTNAGAVEFSLYVENSDSKGWDASTDVSSGVTHDVLSGDSKSGSGVWKGKEESNSSISRVFAARTFKNNGLDDETDSDVIYLNITGRPAAAFRDKAAYDALDPKAGEELGTITLSFSTTSVPAGPLTPSDGDTTNP